MRVLQIDSDALRRKLRFIGECFVVPELLRLYAGALAEKLPGGTITPYFFVYLGRAVSTSFSLQADDGFFSAVDREQGGELLRLIAGWRSYAPLPVSYRRSISASETSVLPSTLPFFVPDGPRYVSFVKKVRMLICSLEIGGK